VQAQDPGSASVSRSEPEGERSEMPASVSLVDLVGVG
jgi:hypothetical protein